MTDLERAEWEMIARARQALSPSPADQARVRSAMLSAIAQGAAGVSLERDRELAGNLDDLLRSERHDPLVSAEGATRLPNWVSKLLSGVLIAAPAFGAGYFMGRQADRAPTSDKPAITAPVERPTTTPTTRAPELPSVAPPAEPRDDSPPEEASDPSKPTAQKPPRISLEEELLLLRRAESALRAGDPGRALSLLEELDQKAPGGTLAEERRASFVTARCQLGADATTTALARNFARRYPKSVYLKRVEQACHLEE